MDIISTRTHQFGPYSKKLNLDLARAAMAHIGIVAATMVFQQLQVVVQ